MLLLKHYIQILNKTTVEIECDLLVQLKLKKLQLYKAMFSVRRLVSTIVTSSRHKVLNPNSLSVFNQQIVPFLLPNNSFCSGKQQQLVDNSNSHTNTNTGDINSDSDCELSESESEDEINQIMPFTASDGKVFESKKLNKGRKKTKQNMSCQRCCNDTKSKRTGYVT